MIELFRLVALHLAIAAVLIGTFGLHVTLRTLISFRRCRRVGRLTAR